MSEQTESPKHKQMLWAKESASKPWETIEVDVDIGRSQEEVRFAIEAMLEHSNGDDGYIPPEHRNAWLIASQICNLAMQVHRLTEAIENHE